MSSIYRLDGRVYEWLNRVLTLGIEDRFKAATIGQLGIRPGDRILDWGCGTGLGIPLTVPLLQGEGAYCGVDVSASMLRHAVSRSRSWPRIEYQFVLRDGFDLRLTPAANVAMAAYSLGVLQPELFEPALAEIWRNLEPGGRLMIYDMYVPEVESASERIYQWLTKAVSRSVFQQDFSGDLMPTVNRYFKEAWIDPRPNMMAFAYVGERREEPIDA